MVSRGIRKSALAVSAAIILIFTIILSPVEGQEAVSEDRLSTDINGSSLPYVVNRGVTTDIFGGGSYIIVKFNDTLAFGIVYGNTRIETPITIFSVNSNVQSELTDGREKLTIDSYTVTATRIDSIYEYVDANGNSLYDLMEETDHREMETTTRSGELPQISADTSSDSSTVKDEPTDEKNNTDEPDLSADSGSGSVSADNSTDSVKNETKDPALSVDSNTNATADDKEPDTVDDGSDEPTLSVDSGNESMSTSNDTDTVVDESDEPSLSADTGGDAILDEYDADSTDQMERVVKKVSLSRAWTGTSFKSEKSRDGSFIWSFSLFAENLKYEYPQNSAIRPSPSQDSSGSVLEDVRINFKITVSPITGPNVVTEYSTVSSAGSEDLSTIVNEKQQRILGRKLTLKIDHDIHGWDAARDNEAPMLYLGTTMIFGLSVPLSTHNALEEKELLHILPSAALRTRIVKGFGGLNLDNIVSRDWKMANTSIAQGELTSRVASKFSSSISIDPYDVPSTGPPGAFNFQFMNGNFVGPSSSIWKLMKKHDRITAGLAIHGGYNYPVSARIYHDPSIVANGYEPEVKVKPGVEENRTIIDFLPEAEISIPIIALALVIVVAAGAAILIGPGQKRNFVIYDDLLDEEEEELFKIKRKKKDWDRLKIDKA